MSFFLVEEKCQRVVSGIMEGVDTQLSARALRGDGCALHRGPQGRTALLT